MLQLGRAKESSAAEFISAMAGGWKSKLIVEAWTNNNGAIASSIGLAIAAHHSGGRHVCIVPDEMSKREYISAMGTFCGRFLLPEIMVGDASVLLLERLPGIDFLVVDGHRKDVSSIFSFAKLSHLGAVVVCKNSSKSKFFGLRWNRVLGRAAKVVRSLILPNGLDIAYVAAAASASAADDDSRKGPNRWIRQIDQKSGEEHVYRR